MPEMWFKVQWPDGAQEICYSPSTVVATYLAEGRRYSVASFLELVRPALNRASERVEAKFGYRCSSADDQLQKLEESAARVGVDGAGEVVVLYLGRDRP